MCLERPNNAVYILLESCHIVIWIHCCNMSKCLSVRHVSDICAHFAGWIMAGRVKKGRHELDNRWVVPYNPYLCQKFDCHINVEVCATIKAVKYIYKYVYKGHDRAQVEVTR